MPYLCQQQKVVSYVAQGPPTHTPTHTHLHLLHICLHIQHILLHIQHNLDPPPALPTPPSDAQHCPSHNNDVKR